MATLHLAVDFRARRRDVSMGDAQVRKMPNKLRTEGRIVVCLDLLNSKREMLSHLLKRLDRRARIVVVVDVQHLILRRLVNCNELVEARLASLARAARGTNFTASYTERPGTWSGASSGFGPGRYLFYEIGPTR